MNRSSVFDSAEVDLSHAGIDEALARPANLVKDTPITLAAAALSAAADVLSKETLSQNDEGKLLAAGRCLNACADRVPPETAEEATKLLASVDPNRRKRQQRHRIGQRLFNLSIRLTRLAARSEQRLRVDCLGIPPTHVRLSPAGADIWLQNASDREVAGALVRNTYAVRHLRRQGPERTDDSETAALLTGIAILTEDLERRHVSGQQTGAPKRKEKR
jgi:hypothetical protein